MSRYLFLSRDEKANLEDFQETERTKDDREERRERESYRFVCFLKDGLHRFSEVQRCQKV